MRWLGFCVARLMHLRGHQGTNFAYAAADRSGDGTIEVAETRLLFTHLLMACEARETFEEIHLDNELPFPAAVPLNKDDVAEGLGKIKENLDIDLDGQDLDPLFNEMDSEDSGVVSLVDFIKWVGTRNHAGDDDALADTARGWEVAKYAVLQVVGAGTCDYSAAELACIY